MPQFYRVLKADPIGDPWTPNKAGAKPLQGFWCQVEGEELPVMINKQVPNQPSLTEGHYGVLEDTRSAKGNPYKKFVSMQIPQGMSKPRYDGVSAPVPQDDEGEPYWFAPYRKRLDNLEKLLATPVEQLPDPDEVDEDKLKGIFGEDIQVQEIPNKES